jgi:hypothetical protein
MQHSSSSHGALEAPCPCVSLAHGRGVMPCFMPLKLPRARQQSILTALSYTQTHLRHWLVPCIVRVGRHAVRSQCDALVVSSMTLGACSQLFRAYVHFMPQCVAAHHTVVMACCATLIAPQERLPSVLTAPSFLQSQLVTMGCTVQCTCELTCRAAHLWSQASHSERVHSLPRANVDVLPSLVTNTHR